MKCSASGCTPLFCSYHKAGFQCATPGCTHHVQVQKIYGPSEFLDTGYADRQVLGVAVDPAITQRTPQVYREVTQPDANGILQTVMRPCPRTEKEKHQYLCQACSSQIVTKRERARGHESLLMEARLRRHKAKHILVPENDRKRLIYGKQVEIRVLGPGLGGDDLVLLDNLRNSCLSIVPQTQDIIPAHQASAVLPVKLYGEESLLHTGVAKKKDRTTYGVTLGVYVDGVLQGQCELGLHSGETQLKNTVLVKTMMIGNFFLNPSVRGLGISRFLMSYVIDLSRFLKTEFGTHISHLLMTVSPHNSAMNAVAEKHGFTAMWRLDDAMPECNLWVFSLHRSKQEAIEANRQSRFLQQLTLPIAVRYRRDVHFGFVYNFQNQLHAACHAMQIPSPSWHVEEHNSIALYKMNDYLQARNLYPFKEEWLHAQAAFFCSLSADEHLTILTYSYRGDQMINRFMQFGTVHGESCSRVEDRLAEWYCHSIDNLQYILFQPQLRTVYGEEFAVRNAADVRRIACLLRTWDMPTWKPVMQQYMRDLRDLFHRAPPLLSPMTTYRGEQHAHKYGDLCSAEANTENRVISSSLDASVGALFAQPMQGYAWRQAPGTIYAINWPVGTKLIFTLGANVTINIMECEVRALQPHFRPLRHWGTAGFGSGMEAYTDTVTVEYMCPAQRGPPGRARIEPALITTEYTIRYLEAT